VVLLRKAHEIPAHEGSRKGTKRETRGFIVLAAKTKHSPEDRNEFLLPVVYSSIALITPLCMKMDRMGRGEPRKKNLRVESGISGSLPNGVVRMGAAVLVEMGKSLRATSLDSKGPLRHRRPWALS